jgi:hypothetical protein
VSGSRLLGAFGSCVARCWGPLPRRPGDRPWLQAVPGQTAANLATDLTFWSGKRASASSSDWATHTDRSCVARCYHRIIDERAPGQERMSLSPKVVRQLQVLHLLRYGPLTSDEVVSFHKGPTQIGKRRYVLTADDGFVDSVTEMASTTDAKSQLLVPTAASGLRPPARRSAAATSRRRRPDLGHESTAPRGRASSRSSGSER